MLSKRTIERLRKAELFILQEPRRFDMLSGITNQTYNSLEKPPCGTMCCIAGAGYIIGKRLRNLKDLRFNWENSVKPFATKYFGLTREQAHQLFYPTTQTWRNFWFRYNEAKTALDRALIGCACIESFISENS